jgi:hypothetical protein
VQTYRDLKARRKHLAEEIASIPLKQRREEMRYVAYKYRVSVATVLGACREHGVNLKSRTKNLG